MTTDFSQETQLAACIHINAMNVAGLEFQKQLVNIEGVVFDSSFPSVKWCFAKEIMIGMGLLLGVRF